MKCILTAIAFALTCVLSANLYAGAIKKKRTWEENIILSKGINKINDGLYVCVTKDNLYFALERVTDETKKFWVEYSNIQKEALLELLKFNRYVYLEIKKECNLLSQTQMKEPFIVDYYKTKYKSYNEEKKLLTCAEDAIDAFNDILTYHNKDHIWVAYMTERPITAESINFSLKKRGDIEISCGVATNDKILFSSHVGIFRSLVFNSEHRQLSMQLHSLIAQTIQKAYDNKKEYMITTPLPDMRDIIVKNVNNLHKDAVWKNNEKKTLSYSKDNDEATITNRSGKKIIFTKPDFLDSCFLEEKSGLLLGEKCKFETIIIDINALADVMKLD